MTNTGRQAQGATAPGISIRATNNSLVADNNTNHNSDTGIYVTNTSTGNTVTNNESSFNAQGWQRNANGINVTSPGNVVTGNVTHDNEDTGIQLYTGGNNNLVTLNVTYNNGDHGIDNLNVTGGPIVGNTVFHNCTSGINLEGVTSGSYRIANNIAVDNAVYPAYAGIACARRAGNIGVWDGAQNSTLVDHNLVYLSKTGVMYAWGTTYTSLTAMRRRPGRRARRPGRPEVRGHEARGTSRCARAPRPSTAVTAGCPASRPPTSSATRACATRTSPTRSRPAPASTTTSAPTSTSPTCRRRGAAAGRRPDADADRGYGPAGGERRRVRVDRPAGPDPPLLVRLR